jgi:hypothetical protein
MPYLEPVEYKPSPEIVAYSSIQKISVNPRGDVAIATSMGTTLAQGFTPPGAHFRREGVDGDLSAHVGARILRAYEGVARDADDCGHWAFLLLVTSAGSLCIYWFCASGAYIELYDAPEDFNLAHWLRIRT